VACLFGWVVVNLLDDDGFGFRSALVVWLVTLLGGMGLRILAGGGAALPFVLVATLVLAAALFGWRLVAGLVRRGGAQSSAAVPSSGGCGAWTDWAWGAARGMLAGLGPV